MAPSVSHAPSFKGCRVYQAPSGVLPRQMKREKAYRLDLELMRTRGRTDWPSMGTGRPAQGCIALMEGRAATSSSSAYTQLQREAVAEEVEHAREIPPRRVVVASALWSLSSSLRLSSAKNTMEPASRFTADKANDPATATPSLDQRLDGDHDRGTASSSTPHKRLSAGEGGGTPSAGAPSR